MGSRRFFHNVDAKSIAARLITSEGELHGHSAFTIEHVFIDPYPTADEVAATMKIPALYAALHSGLATNREAINAVPPVMFLVRYNWSVWTHELTDLQREATVHHELHHIDPFGPGLAGHDIEEFVRTFKKYGAYHQELSLFTAGGLQ